MSYKVYSGRFLAGPGYPVIIVTDPKLSGEKYVSECHSFFSGDSKTYALTECKYDTEDKDQIDDEVFVETVKQHGENRIYNHLSEVSSVQYQAMLAGFGYSITDAAENCLLQLHLRNFLSKEIEAKIVHSSNDRELKDYLRSIGKIGRITTKEKI